MRDEGPVLSAVGECFGCGRPFLFDPDRVPSVVVDGVRREVCRACVARANPIRKANGLDPIVPLVGAYFEDVDVQGDEDDDL